MLHHTGLGNAAVMCDEHDGSGGSLDVDSSDARAQSSLEWSALRHSEHSLPSPPELSPSTVATMGLNPPARGLLGVARQAII